MEEMFREVMDERYGVLEDIFGRLEEIWVKSLKE